MTYLKNTWYVAAWAEELGREPLGRKLLGQEVVMYRKENGEAVAIGGVCPHRFAPLSMGRLIGDEIECGYHGLRFNCQGACVFNPNGNGTVPAKARVPEFRIEERHKLIWLWGGDAELADTGTIPDLSFLEDPDKAHVLGHLFVDAHYELYIDNLMDLTHAQFVHRDQLGVDNYHAASFQVSEADDRVRAEIVIPDSDMPPALRSIVGESDKRGKFTLIAYWQPPSIVTNDIRFLETNEKDPLFRSLGTHIVIPESENTAHYFYALTRSHRIDDPEADKAARQWHLRGFSQQDKPIIEAAARMMGNETDPLALGAAGIQTDGANLRARRILKRRIEQESSQGA